MDKNKNVTYIVIAVAIIVIIIIIPLTYIIYNDYVYSRQCTHSPVAPIPVTPIISPPSHQSPMTPIISPPSHHPLTSQTSLFPSLCPSYTRHVNANIYGKSIDEAPMKDITEQQCQQACDLKQCDWYNYDQSKKYCWLKQGLTKNNYITGFNVVDTPGDLTCPKFHVVKNMDVDGKTLNYTKNINENECQSLCNNMTCNWYNYNNDTQECWLKQADITNDMITGIKL
ncbi:hypothetical protein QJ857_gp0573 [Tupanvirus soda lake]|uniref:Apple domain-containing protein n=2 Tax=Tupanvirus TaxID=2094720 RepID=A0A6N1NNE6_9VIRU|nr:hypothetical protein QJ857_gp0573 [Tupanvirus soda lake]QKU35470.1 hypothetical protein [Tupanvirus soda lake]